MADPSHHFAYDDDRQRWVLVVTAAFLVCAAAVVAAAAGSAAAGGVVISLAGLGYAIAVLTLPAPSLPSRLPARRRSVLLKTTSASVALTAATLVLVAAHVASTAPLAAGCVAALGSGGVALWAAIS